MQPDIENALLLRKPVEVGKAVREALVIELRVADDDPRLTTGVCANYLRAIAPDLHFKQWRKLAAGIVALSASRGEQLDYVQLMLTPFKKRYELFRDPNAQLSEALDYENALAISGNATDTDFASGEDRGQPPTWGESLRPDWISLLCLRLDPRARREKLCWRPRYMHLLKDTSDMTPNAGTRTRTEIGEPPLVTEDMRHVRRRTVEDALQCVEPAEAGRTLNLAASEDYEEAPVIELFQPIDLRRTAIWLCGWAPDMDFQAWRKLAEGLIAFAQAIGESVAELRALLTPMDHVFQHYQDLEVLLDDLEDESVEAMAGDGDDDELTEILEEYLNRS